MNKPLNQTMMKKEGDICLITEYDPFIDPVFFNFNTTFCTLGVLLLSTLAAAAQKKRNKQGPKSPVPDPNTRYLYYIYTVVDLAS
jgi:hypothetical protein